jgi:hypothetical protein
VPTSTTEGSPEAFSEAGNNICRQAKERLDPLAAVVFDGDAPTDTELGEFHEILVADLERQIAEFEAIPVAGDLADRADEYLQAARQALSTVRQLEPQGLLSDADPFEDANQLAIGLGLTDCAG